MTSLRCMQGRTASQLLGGGSPFINVRARVIVGGGPRTVGKVTGRETRVIIAVSSRLFANQSTMKRGSQRSTAIFSRVICPASERRRLEESPAPHRRPCLAVTAALARIFAQIANGGSAPSVGVSEDS